MNIINLSNNGFTARFFAVITIVSMLLSALPVAFFVAQAAPGNTDAVGTILVIVNPNPAAGNPEIAGVRFNGTGTLNLEGWTLSDDVGLKHTYKAGTLLTDTERYNVCGNLTFSTCDELIDSGGNTVWNNTGDTLTLRDDQGAVVKTVTWGDLAGDEPTTISDGAAAVDYSTPVTPDPIIGCLDADATNYNPDATEQGDVICEYSEDEPAEPKDTVSIEITKIVCDDEALLPNRTFVKGLPTAAQFLASTPERTAGCQLAAGFEFQWTEGEQSSDDVLNNGDAADAPWETSTPTDGTGLTTITIPADDLENNSSLSVREVLDTTQYIPFSGKNGSDVSAEFYCQDDIQFYDNMEWITDVENDDSETYRCMAWNVPVVEEEPKAMLRVCKMIVDESGAITDGAYTEGEFSVDVTGPDGYDETFTFATPLVPNTDLVNDNGAELDAECKEVEMVRNGQYKYTEETIINGNAVWATPLYHDFFTETPDELADFNVFTIDGSSNDDNDTDGVINIQKGKTRTLAIVNTIESIPSVTVSATKIVCDYESELPDWSGSVPGDLVTADTAQNWLDEQGEGSSCRIVPDWEFEWAASSASNPGNAFVGVGGVAWTTFSGSTEVPLEAVDSRSFWVREVLPVEYIPFGGSNSANDVSAELYCHKDGLNYDNYDRIDSPKVDETYHCVAWNVPKELPPQTCSIVSDTGTLVDTNEYAVETYVHKNWTDIDGAEWVWATDRVENPEMDETYTFSETFVVNDPTSAQLEVAADNTLLIKVNGVVVLDQTDQNNFNMTQTVDILADLQNGENTVEFTVKNNGKDRSNDRTNPAGVLYRLDIESPVACEVTTEPESEPELPPVTSCSYVSDLAINDTPSQSNVAANLTSFTLNDFVYSTGDEFDLFVGGDIAANGAFGDEVVVERTADGLRVFFYGTGVNGGPVTEFSGSFMLNGVDLTNAVIAADSEPNEPTGPWPDAFTVDQTTGEVTFSLFTNSGNDSFVISGLTENCLPPVDPEPDTYRISGVKYEVDGESDPVLAAGWTIYASNGVDAPLSTTTDSDGAYYFDVLPGEWEVYEEDRTNWTLVDIEQYPYMFSTEVSFEEELETQTSCEFFVGEKRPLLQTASVELLSLQSIEFEAEEGDFELVGYQCDFYNEFDEPDTEVEPEPEVNNRSGGSRSSGTRIAQATPTPVVLGETTTNICPFLVDHMQMGVENDRTEVMKLQIFLNVFKDLFGGTENPVTGTFGATTDANVKAFQEAYRSEVLDPWYDQGIVPHNRPTGFVYRTTLWKINDIVCDAVFPDLSGETLDENVAINVAPVAD